MKNARLCVRAIFLLLLVAIFLSMMPLSMASYVSPNSSLETDTQWVSKESLTLQWGKAQRVDINGVTYTLRADDFDVGLKAASISIEKEGEIIREFLFADIESDSYLIWDYDFKVELTDVTEDGSKTPSASVTVYERGLPELKVTLSTESQTYGVVSVSETQYAPEEERLINVDVENIGDAWAENLLLTIDVGEVDLKSYKDFELRDGVLKKRLEWMDKGESQCYNFTVIFPEWDGVTSPYAINYTISAIVSGNDIKNEACEGNASLNFTCTDPVLKVVSFVSKEELNMTPWYIEDVTVHDAWETTTFRVDVYNQGFYTVSGLDVTFPEIPNEFLVDTIFESGNPQVISKKDPYYSSKKLVPIRQGSFIINTTVAKVNFFGKNFTWESESKTINVHGAYLTLDKSLVQNGSGYDVVLTVKDDGDRAAWIDIKDYVPYVANYVEGSFEKSLPDSNRTLSDWDLTSTIFSDGSHSIGVQGVLLSPGESLDLSYHIEPDEAPDLPYAECEFKSLEGYKGTIRSAFFVAGTRVEQNYDIVTGEWVAAQSSEVQAEAETTDETLYSPENNSNPSEDEPFQIMSVEESTPEPSFFGSVLEKISKVFDSVELGLKSAFTGVNNIIGPAISAIESVAVNAVENYLYAVIAIVAVGVFLIVVVLMQR
ncbi:hypothetical protein [uncultured Methanomethylovorans sp.]|uniref:hypothetical protein n=1 Tax=uncultured Methanomethylovorans sp. TaxID=183759 RepID=UPI002AA6AC91|nr:hypothetical protein [uncultured Methanomethylovorans sp.]